MIVQVLETPHAPHPLTVQRHLEAYAQDLGAEVIVSRVYDVRDADKPREDPA